MKTIFETCNPRAEVLKGELRDEMFAARLKQVIEGHADPIYKDARTFFENTYVTDGLRTLAREVLGRLSGQEPASSPFLRLETSFGGGKTHSLIALYHLAQGHADGLPRDLVPVSWIPTSPWPTAGLVGWELEAATEVDHGEFSTRTLWGEIAYQIGRYTLGERAAYEIVRVHDEGLVAPGAPVLEKLIGDGPALIMLDEVARYLRVARAVPTANAQSNLAEQTVAFLMALIEFAASKPRVSLVLTLAERRDAFGNETEELQQELAEMRRISARQERVITPAGETEISRIVTHRLFQRIDPIAARESARAYHEYWSHLDSQGEDLPHWALSAEYADEMTRDYPFHPELLNTLNRKTSTIPNFQRTRGALRLLARAIRSLWNEQPENTYLFCVHHLDLGLEDVKNELTSRLERPAFTSVIEADIASSKRGAISHAQALDRRWTEQGKPPYARRTAINVFLHSLTQGSAAGVHPSELMLSVLQPGDDPQLVRKTLSLMLAEEKVEPGTAFWFLHWDGHRYRFKTEPSLEKVIQDEMPLVGRTAARNEVDDRIRRIWKEGAFKPSFFPAEAGDLDDDARQPKLAILHYDAAVSTASATAPPELGSKLFDHAGSLEGYRIYKNNVLFLVADREQVERMVDVAQRYRAIRRIVSEADRMADFNDEQRKRLREMQDEAEIDVRVAITRAYRYLYYPTTDAPREGGGLARETLPAQDQGEVSKDQTAVILRVLRQLQKVLMADDPPMPPAYVKARAWSHGQVSLSTEDLQREFSKRIGLKILLDPNQLKKTIKAGCKQGVWIYFDAAEQTGYGPTSPDPLAQISEDALLYTPEEASRLGLRVKGESLSSPEPCPLCDELECVCDRQDDRKGADGSGARPFLLRFSLDGAPGQVFQGIIDRFQDSGRTMVGRLVVRCEGMGREAAADARALGLAIPQLGKGSYRIEQNLSAEFGLPPNREAFTASFEGSWERYKRVKQLTDAFGQEANKVNVRTVLRATYDEGLPVTSDQFQTLRDVFTSLGMGKLVVEVEEAAVQEVS